MTMGAGSDIDKENKVISIYKNFKNNIYVNYFRLYEKKNEKIFLCI